MAIPDVDDFNLLLSSFTLQEPRNPGDFDRIEAVPERVVSDLSGMGSLKPIWLWHSKSCALTPSRLIDRVRKELQSKGHASGADAALALLAILSLRSGGTESPVACLNAITGAIGTAESAQYLIAPFPPHPDFRELELGGFVIGLVDRQRMMYRCRKIGCDYFDRYPNQFTNRFAIMRSQVAVQVLDWPHIRESLNITPTNAGGAIVDHYFELITRHLQEVFRFDFRSAQEVYVAAGAPYIDLDQPWAWNGGTFVVMFQNMGRHRAGYFCPLNTGVAIDFAQADRRLLAKAQELQSVYSFTGKGSSEIHKTLDTYCRFVVKARIHEKDGRQDEAFLHYVIALDLLFGDKDASTQKVSKRAAIVTSRFLGESFLSTVDRMRTIYHRRSRYVHAGEVAGENVLESVRPIVNAVLYCLLRLQGDSGNSQDGFVEHWLRTLDYFVAAADAGKDVAEQDLIAAGIAIDSQSTTAT